MGAKPKKNRGGRPRTRPPQPGRRETVSVRVTPRLRALLDKAAEESGRSISQEAEAIIEHYFQRRELLRETLELGYGSKHLAGLLQAIGDTAFRITAGAQALLYVQHKSNV